MKKVLLFILSLGVSLGVATASMATSYQIVPYSTGWDWATTGSGGASSLGAGWHLAVITSQAEQDEVASLLSTYVASQTGSDRAYWQFWIGGSQLGVPYAGGEVTPTMAADANWKWITGETWDKTFWGTGEPNDQNSAYVSHASEEGFLTMDSRYGWKWNDEEYYTWIAGYVAEYTPVPEPSTLLLLGAGLLGAGILRRRIRN